MASNNADMDNNGIPDFIQATPVPERVAAAAATAAAPQLAALEALGIDVSAFQKQEEVPVFVMGGVEPMAPSDAKDWYEAQQVQKTPVWQQIKETLKPLGYKTDSQVLTALRAGVDYTQNSYSTRSADGSANPFEFIMAQPARESGSGSGGPFSQTQTNVTLSSPSQAAAIADNAFQGEIGRMVTQPEADDFQKSLNIMQRENPSKSVTKGYSSNGSTTSSSTTTGGFDPTLFARDWARSQGDYAESFGASTFMKVLDQVISQPDVIGQRMEGIG